MYKKNIHRNILLTFTIEYKNKFDISFILFTEQLHLKLHIGNQP